DFAEQTAGTLENGFPGNRLGGIGSGLAYAGGNTFLAVPDRGPNATVYQPLVDNTVSYINRFHTFKLSLAPSDPGSPFPFTLTPMLTRTTLLSSHTPLFYGTGASVGLGSGVPALNRLTLLTILPAVRTISTHCKLRPILLMRDSIRKVSGFPM